MSEFMVWVGVIVGIVAAVAIVEVLIGTILNRYGTSVHPGRAGTQLPRILNKK